MPLEFTQHGGQLTVTATGKVTCADLLGFIEQQWVSLPHDAGVLFDGRTATVDLSTIDIRTLAFATAKRRNLPRLAIVTHKDLEFGLARMYELQSGLDGTIHVFRAVDEAALWLGSRPPKN